MQDLTPSLYDAHMKLHKVGIRYYGASQGRWTQRDPVQNSMDPKSWNPCTYVGQNPPNAIDPLFR